MCPRLGAEEAGNLAMPTGTDKRKPPQKSALPVSGIQVKDRISVNISKNREQGHIDIQRSYTEIDTLHDYTAQNGILLSNKKTHK